MGGENHSASGCSVQVTKDHCLNNNCCSPHVRNTHQFTVAFCFFGIPGCKHQFNGPGKLQPGIFRNGDTELQDFLLIAQGQFLHLIRSEQSFDTDAMTGFGFIHQSLKDFPFYIQGHGPGLQEASEVVPGQIFFPGNFSNTFDYFDVEADVVNGSHHSWHGNGRSTADRNQKRITLVSIDLARFCLNFVQGLPDLPHELIPGHSIIFYHGPAAKNLSGNDKARGNGLFIYCQQAQVITFVAEKNDIAGVGALLVYMVDNFFRIIGHQQVDHFFVQELFLALQDVIDSGDEVVEVLEAECFGYQVTHEGLRQAVYGLLVYTGGLRFSLFLLFFLPQVAVLGKQLG